jgi:hypothetical protein
MRVAAAMLSRSCATGSIAEGAVVATVGEVTGGVFAQPTNAKCKMQILPTTGVGRRSLACAALLHFAF